MSKESGSLNRSRRKGHDTLLLEFSLHFTRCHCAGCPHVLGPWPPNARPLPGDRPPPRWECLVPVTSLPGRPTSTPGCRLGTKTHPPDTPGDHWGPLLPLHRSPLWCPLLLSLSYTYRFCRRLAISAPNPGNLSERAAHSDFILCLLFRKTMQLETPLPHPHRPVFRPSRCP